MNNPISELNTTQSSSLKELTTATIIEIREGKKEARQSKQALSKDALLIQTEIVKHTEAHKAQIQAGSNQRLSLIDEEIQAILNDTH